MKYLKASINTFTRIQKFFIAFFVVGFVSNIIFDAITYVHRGASAEAGQQVEHTHTVLNHLRVLEELTDQYLVGEKSNKTAIESEIASLQSLVKHQDVRRLLDELPAQSGQPRGLSIITKMINIESDLLQERTQREVITGETYEIMLSRILLADGLLFGAMLLFFVLALRERKKSEWNLIESLNNIREANINLEAEIIRRQNKVKMTVHDLKNPLGSIAGFASLIADDNERTSIHDYSAAIKNISSKSLALVDSLLDSSDTDLPLEQIDLLKILMDVYQQSLIAATTKGQRIIFETTLRTALIKGNATKLEEVFANLLGNAIKYSPPNEPIWIRCFTRDNFHCVEIEDRGPGFSEDDKKHAFRFEEKLSAKPTGSETSTGLGLFIAKRFTDLHNGNIQILDTMSGVGACLHVEIPAQGNLYKSLGSTGTHIG